MGAKKQSTVEIGTDALPVVIGKDGTSIDFLTWTHNQGVRAVKVEALFATSRAPVQHDEAGLVVINAQTIRIAQPSVNVITVENLSTNVAKSIILRVTFEQLSVGESPTVSAADPSVVIS